MPGSARASIGLLRVIQTLILRASRRVPCNTAPAKYMKGEMSSFGGDITDGLMHGEGRARMLTLR